MRLDDSSVDRRDRRKSQYSREVSFIRCMNDDTYPHNICLRAVHVTQEEVPKLDGIQTRQEQSEL